MGLLVYDLMDFSSGHVVWWWFLGFSGNGKSDHFKDQHGLLMVGFSSNFCFGIVVVIY